MMLSSREPRCSGLSGRSGHSPRTLRPGLALITFVPLVAFRSGRSGDPLWALWPHIAFIALHSGRPRLANRKRVIDSKDLPFRCTLETQNFRPPGEKELIFTAYGYQGTEVCGIDLTTRKVTNYSQAPGQYDEAEGVFPDGKYTCVECDRDNGMKKKGSQYIDIWKLALDGSGRTERLTYFNLYPGYKASNPVVSDDGRFMAFQMAQVGDPAGVGRGIFLYKFAQAARGR